MELGSIVDEGKNARLAAVGSTLGVAIFLAFVASIAALSPLALLKHPSIICRSRTPMATVGSRDTVSMNLPRPPEWKDTVLARSRPVHSCAFWRGAGVVAVSPFTLHVGALMISPYAAPRFAVVVNRGALRKLLSLVLKRKNAFVLVHGVAAATSSHDNEDKDKASNEYSKCNPGQRSSAQSDQPPVVSSFLWKSWPQSLTPMSCRWTCGTVHECGHFLCRQCNLRHSQVATRGQAQSL